MSRTSASSCYIKGDFRDLKLKQVQTGTYNGRNNTGKLWLLPGSKVSLPHIHDRAQLLVDLDASLLSVTHCVGIGKDGGFIQSWGRDSGDDLGCL